MAIEVPDKIEENVIRGINRDYLSSLNSTQPQALNFYVDRMRTGFGSLSEIAKTFLDDNVINYIKDYEYTPTKNPLDFIYGAKNVLADTKALMPKINTKVN